MTATANGFGKRTPVDQYNRQGRGGQGVISIRTSERNGEVVGAAQVEEGDEVMLISDVGTLVRTPVDDISVTGRNTQGVTLISLNGEQRLIGVEKIVQLGGDDEPADAGEDADADASD